jgi:hypothetical protein
MSYVGNTALTQSFSSGTDYFSGNGATTAFTLSRPVASVNDVEAVIENVVQQPSTAYTISGSTITFTSAPPSGTNNIYVRYMTTTTQVVQPAQNSVGYSSLNSDMQGATAGFKNRIINGAMVIDQRNAGTTVTAGTSPNSTGSGWTCDRWQSISNANDYTTKQSTDAPAGFRYSSLITTTATKTLSNGTYASLIQQIEGYNIADLGWGTSSASAVTLSFWVKSTKTGIYSIVLKDNNGSDSYCTEYTINSQNTWEKKTITVPGPANWNGSTTNSLGVQIAFWMAGQNTQSSTLNQWNSGNINMSTNQVNLFDAIGATFQLTGVQFEKGSTATSFDYRSFGTELTLCQRYFYTQSAVNWSDNYCRFENVMGYSGTYCNFIAILPVPMRSAPSLYSTGASSYNLWNGSFFNISAISIASYPTVNGVRCDLTITSSGITQGAMYHLLANANNTAQYGFSAEL